jgi:hypothetical protein
VDFAGRAKRLLHRVAFAVATFQKRVAFAFCRVAFAVARMQSTSEVVGVGGASGSCTVAANVETRIGRDTKVFALIIRSLSKKT